MAAEYPEPLCERLAGAYWKALETEPQNAKAWEVRYDIQGPIAEHEEETRRRKQDRENNECIGGLRRPHRGLAKLPEYPQVGERILTV